MYTYPFLLLEKEFLIVAFRNAVQPLIFVSDDDSPLFHDSVHEIDLATIVKSYCFKVS